MFSTPSCSSRGPFQVTYQPNPVDTSAVPLPAHLHEALETLAQNTHDVWAQQRIEDGWHYGPERDDRRKLHPCLVPYDQLPDSEKEYDRQTAEQVLKVILALGYRIEPAGR